MSPSIEIYDTTLRDGAQGEHVSFSVEDKLRIARRLDALGIHFIEGGWPGSNPKDDEFFKNRPRLKTAKLVAFGSVGRRARDPMLKSLVAARADLFTVFGKSWDLAVRRALRVPLEENLRQIIHSIAFLRRKRPVFFDAEHFFDGFRANRDYALAVLKAAEQGGATRLILCDTNGGSLPTDVHRIVLEVRRRTRVPLGIHGHNDGELAVANSLAAVEAGAIQIHGTINGIGERCGNANLVSILPNLVLKKGIGCVTRRQLRRLREVSRFVDELLNRAPADHQPYVGDSSFAHKGGVHVSAILRDRRIYEHVDPMEVGNRQRILISDQSGRAGLIYKAAEYGLKVRRDPVARRLLEEIKELERGGFEFEGAEASLEIRLKKALGRHRRFFRLIGFRVIDEKRSAGEAPRAEATIRIEVDGELEHTAAVGVGPVNALDNALRKALERFYPELREVRLVDYKVRVLPAGSGTASRVRVLIESRDGREKWGTVGVSENIIEASWVALVDSLEYKLMRGKKSGTR